MNKTIMGVDGVREIFYISDTHFWHSNIIKYEPEARGHFTSAEEMNHALITNWNRKVSDDDLVIHLGDFIFGGLQKAEEILQQLKGRKVLIKGNHDIHCQKERFTKYWDGLYQVWKGKIRDKFMVLSHCPFEVWDYQENPNSSLHMYGHVHSLIDNNLSEDEQGVDRKYRKIKYVPNRFNAGVDINNLEPVSLEECIDNNKVWAKKVWGREKQHGK